MNCPVCQSALAAGQQGCPACGAALGLPVEGALATDPKTRGEPLRELPGRRKRERERNWRDEVKERVDRRRRAGSAAARAELPLFREAPSAPEPPEAAQTPAVKAKEPGPTQLGTDAFRVPMAPPYELDDERRVAPEARFEPVQGGHELFDQPRLESAAPAFEEPDVELPLHVGDGATPHLPFEPRPFEEPAEDEWPTDEGSLPGLVRPVERPAQLAERAQAALLDLGVLAGLSAVVVYFAGRAAKVPLAGLQPTWPYLLGYLGLLGLLYAAYFTGTTGQTLGKMMFDLRVVDTSGQAPGYLRACGRCALGALGTLALGLGLVPILFDPARRGFHDRLFRTRVVRPEPPSLRQ